MSHRGNKGPIEVFYRGEFAYPIHIQENFSQLGGVLESLVLEGRKICIVSDHNVYPLLYKEISTVFFLLREGGFLCVSGRGGQQAAGNGA